MHVSPRTALGATYTRIFDRLNLLEDAGFLSEKGVRYLSTVIRLSEDRGYCWAKHKHLAKQIRCSRRTIIRFQATCEQLGILKVTSRPGKPSILKVQYEHLNAIIGGWEEGMARVRNRESLKVLAFPEGDGV